MNSSARLEKGNELRLEIQRCSGWRCTSFNLRAALAMVPSFCQRLLVRVTYRLSGTLDRLRKLDMAQHCKCQWTASGVGNNMGRWFRVRRQRLHAHAPEVAPARFGARFPTRSHRSLSGHSASFGGLCCITSIYSTRTRRALARLKPVTVDTFPVALGILVTGSRRRRSGQVRSGQVRSGQVRSGQVSYSAEV